MQRKVTPRPTTVFVRRRGWATVLNRTRAQAYVVRYNFAPYAISVVAADQILDERHV